MQWTAASRPAADRNAARAVARTSWAALAVFCVAFAVLEVVNHGPAALAAALVFAVAPDLTMLIGGAAGGGLPAPRAVPYSNLAHRVWPPLALLVGYTVSPLTWAPLFTAGLAWLAHIAVDRALGHGPRTPEGARRG